MIRRPWENNALAANGLAVCENFADWFGCSKVVGELGAPLQVYHGTNKSFDVFHNRFANRPWEMFSDSPQYASRFSEGLGGNVMPVYLAIENPLDLRRLPALRGDARAKLIGLFSRVGFEMPQEKIPCERDLFQIINMMGHHTDFAQRLINHGFDGIIMPDVHEGSHDDRSVLEATTFIALSPNQIKSAVGNSGLFLKNSPSVDDQEAARRLATSLRARAQIQSGAQQLEMQP